MVDVHGRVGAQALVQEVDELLERAALGLPVLGPEGGEAPVRVDDAEEVLETALRIPERVALHVEEEVARRRLRQEREAGLGRGREQLEVLLAGLACAELERRLVAETQQGAFGLRQSRELGERRDSAGAQLLVLRPPQAGHLREVVALRPHPLAGGLEVTEPAEGDRVRLGLAVLRRERDEAAPEPPVVGAEVLGPKLLALSRAQLDVHVRRSTALDPGELLGVEAELEHVSRLRMPRELRVDGLVRPVGLALEEVGDPAPAVGVEEDALVDDVYALRGWPPRSRGPRAPSRGRASREISVDGAARRRGAGRGRRARAPRPCVLTSSASGFSTDGLVTPPSATRRSSCVRCEQAR